MGVAQKISIFGFMIADVSSGGSGIVEKRSSFSSSLDIHFLFFILHECWHQVPYATISKSKMILRRLDGLLYIP
jgi:hypothetical protein